MNSELEKCDAWIRELEARQKTLSKSRNTYLTFFVGMMLASALGFAWHPMLGAATLFTGFFCCAFGFYVVLVRGGEYARELAQIRARAEELRARDGAFDVRS